MSKISLTPNASCAGTFTLASPNSNTSRTLTLPDAAGYQIAENPPNVDYGYEAIWINNDWVIHKYINDPHPNPVEFLDDEDPVTREIKS